jgi:pyruvate,water dikinase
MVLDDLYWLDQIDANQRSQVGDKALDLASLMQRRYPVPPGFVVTAKAFQRFLAGISWKAQMFADLPHSSLYVNVNDFQQLQTVSQQLQQAIEHMPLPPELLTDLMTAIQPWQSEALVVRPSFTLQAGLDPTVSYKTTGLFNSHICRSDPEAFGGGLKQVWCELFRAKSLFYWQRLGIQLQQVRFAVLVQPIHSVVASGKLEIQGSSIEVRAVRGLGHALMQGTADRYLFQPDSGWQTLQSGKQIYAYIIGPTKTDSTALSGWLTDPQSCLQIELLDPAQRAEPVLTLLQLQQLGQAAQQIQTELGMGLALEWMLDAASPLFQITQIIPQFGSIAADAAEALLASATPLIGLAAAPGRAVATAWLMSQADFTSIPAGAIVIASLVTPEQIIQLRQAAGVVTEQGGMTSHAAILARELGIPAVIGVERVTRLIQTGEQVAIDGDRGEVYCGDFDLPADWQHVTAPSELVLLPPDARSRLPRGSTQLFVSLSQLDRLTEIAALPVAGIGLLRSELMLLDLFEQDAPEVWLRRQPEAVNQIADRVAQFAAVFAPRPVFYRSFDLQLSASSSDPSAPHPMLGLRGAFSYQFNLDVLQVQLNALRLVQQRGYDNVSLLLPFVRTVEEFSFCRQQVEQAGLLQQSRFQLWMMAEVPSVLLLLPDYVAAGVQGIAIGTNDLTQLLLGADRDHPQMATAFNPAHLAVRRAIQQLIQSAQAAGIACSICGQSFRQGDFLTQLLEWDVTAISVDPGEIELVYRALRGLRTED